MGEFLLTSLFVIFLLLLYGPISDGIAGDILGINSRPISKKKQTQAIPPASFFTVPEPDRQFVDEGLEQLIADGRFTRAREYVEDMVQLVREMNDRKFEANYDQYRTRIVEASQLSKRTIRKLVS